jgi:hypothetical protein
VLVRDGLQLHGRCRTRPSGRQGRGREAARSAHPHLHREYRAPLPEGCDPFRGGEAGEVVHRLVAHGRGVDARDPQVRASGTEAAGHGLVAGNPGRRVGGNPGFVDCGLELRVLEASEVEGQLADRKGVVSPTAPSPQPGADRARSTCVARWRLESTNLAPCEVGRSGQAEPSLRTV